MEPMTKDINLTQRINRFSPALSVAINTYKPKELMFDFDSHIIEQRNIVLTDPITRTRLYATIVVPDEVCDSTPIILIPPFFNSGQWDTVIARARYYAVNTNNVVITISPPAHGRSDKLRYGSIKGVVTRAVKELSKELNFDTFKLTGFSFGGLIAALIASRAPQCDLNVSHLIVQDPVGTYKQSFSSLIKAYTSDGDFGDVLTKEAFDGRFDGTTFKQGTDSHLQTVAFVWAVFRGDIFKYTNLAKVPTFNDAVTKALIRNPNMEFSAMFGSLSKISNDENGKGLRDFLAELKTKYGDKITSIEIVGTPHLIGETTQIVLHQLQKEFGIIN
jgi:pimeloyl-ACP methyl ester carboxylesterase